MDTTTESVIIDGKLREGTGSSYCYKLRAKGWIPANLLEKGKSTKLEIDPKWLSKAWRRGRQFTLKMPEGERTVRIQELQIDPVKRFPLHVDLMPV